MASKKPVSKKTAKAPAKRATRTPAGLVARAREAAQDAWLAGLGAVAKAQENGNKVIAKITRESRAVQTRALDAANEVKDRLQGMGSIGKLNGRLSQVGDLVGDRAANVLGRAGVATKKDVESLSRRVSKLAAEVEKVAGAKKPAAKPAVKAAVKSVARKAKPIAAAPVVAEASVPA